MNPYLKDIQSETGDKNDNPYLQEEALDLERAKYGISVDEGLKRSPDQESQALKLSREFDVPAPFVSNNIEQFKEAKRKKDFNYDNMAKTNPYLSTWLSDASKVALTQDDMDNVKKVDRNSSRLQFKKREDSLVSDIGKGISSNFVSVEKSVDMARLLYGLGDPEELAIKIANQNKDLAIRSEKAPTYYKEYRQQAGKEFPELQRAFAASIDGMEKAWEGDVLEGLSQFGREGVETVSELFDVLSLMGTSPKALVYGASQSLVNSFAPALVGLIAAPAGGKIGAGIGTTIGGVVGSVVPGAGTAAGAGVGAATGATVGSTAAFFSASTLTGISLEFMLEMEGVLQKNKVDMTDPQQILAAFNNKTIMDEAREKAFNKSITTASVESLISIIGGRFLKGAKPGIAGKIKAVAQAQATEVVGETAGEFAGQIAREGSIQEANLGEALEEGASSIFLGGGMGSISYVVATSNNARKAFSEKITVAAQQVKEIYVKAEEAKNFGQGISDLAEVAKESKLNERDQGALTDLINGSSEDAPVYMQADDWENHWDELGESPIEKADELLPGGRGDLERSLQEGTPLTVPMGDFITKFSEEDSFDKLSQIARKEPEAMSIQQANNLAANIPSLMKQIAAESKVELQKRTTQEEARVAVQNDVESQMRAAGRDNRESKNIGQVFGAHLNAMAEILGIDSFDLFNKRRLEIRGAKDVDITGDVLEQRDELTGFNLKKTEERAPGLAVVTTVVKRELSQFKNPTKFRKPEKARDFKTNINKVLEGKSLINKQTGRSLKLTPESLNNITDQIYRTFEETSANKRNRSKANTIFAESLTALKNLPNLIGDAIHIANENGKNIFSAVGTSPRNNISVKIVTDGDQVVEIQTVASGKRTEAKPTEGVVDTTVQPDLAPTISINEFRDIFNTSRDILFKLFQEDKKGPRGFIDISDPEKLVVTLLESANKSTAIHEIMGHAFLENMKTVNNELAGITTDLNEKQLQFKRDVETILTEFNLDSLEDIKTQHHEQFARLMEAYALEGKAPSRSLRSVFNNFKTWLMSIYKNIAGIERAGGTKLKLTPELREAFNRMLATQEEIAEIHRDMGLTEDDFNTFKALPGISESDVEKIAIARVEARDEAELQLYRKQLAQLKKKKTQEYQTKKKELTQKYTEIADSSPLYTAWTAMTDHTIGGQPVLGYETLKFNTNQLKEILTPEEFKDFPKRLYTQNGINPAITADLMGYASADDLVTAIKVNPDRKGYIRQATQKELDETFPNFMSPEQQDDLKIEALDSVANDKQEQLLKLELDIMFKNSPTQVKKLIKGTARRLPTTKELGDRVEKRIEGLTVRESRSSVFRSIENKARSEAAEFLTKGDFEAALKAKGVEIFNYQLNRKAIEVEKNVEKSLKKNRDRFKKSDKNLAKKGQIDMMKAAQSILNRFQLLTGVQTEKLEAYIDQVKSYDSLAHAKIVGLSTSLIQIDDKNYKDLTVEEFNEVMEVVDALYNLGTAEKSITVDGKKVSKEVVLGELEKNLATLPKNIASSEDNFYQRFKGFASSLIANMTRTEHLISALDKADFSGPFRKFIWNRANDAQLDYNEKKTDRYKQLNDIIDSKFKGVLEDNTDIDLNRFFNQLDPERSKLKKHELMMALVHSGNDSNKKKLLLGRGWGSENADGTLSTLQYDRFIQAMIDEKIITKDIMDGVQEIWDLFEDIKPDIQKTHKEVYGYFFKEIKPTPFTTPWKVYDGGYAPAVTDPMLVEAEASRQNMASTEQQMQQFEMAHTPKGFTKERVEQYAKALSLDFKIIRSHVEKSVRFITLEPAVHDLNRIINNPDFSDALFKVNQNWGNEVLRPWLGRLATQETHRPAETKAGREFSHWLGFLRRNANAQLMFMNMVNTIENLTDIPALFTHMKARSFNDGLKRYIQSPQKLTNHVKDLSRDMKDRLENEIFDINDAYRDLLRPKNTVVGKIQNLQDQLSKHTFITQRTLQNVVEIAAWSGAYDERLAMGDTEKQAVRFADSTIKKVMGSNRPIDLAKVEAGDSIQKVLLTFYSYFLNKGNLVFHSSKEAKAKAYALGIAAPAILSALFRRGVKGKFDEDEDDEYIDDVFDVFFLSQIRFTGAIFPGGGSAVRFIEGQFTDKTFDDRLSISPIISMLEGAKAPIKLLTRDELKGRDIRDAMNFFGTFSGFPLGPAGRPIGFMLDLEQGKQRADNPVDYTRGIITGRSGKR